MSTETPLKPTRTYAEQFANIEITAEQRREARAYALEMMRKCESCHPEWVKGTVVTNLAPIVWSSNFTEILHEHRLALLNGSLSASLCRFLPSLRCFRCGSLSPSPCHPSHSSGLNASVRFCRLWRRRCRSQPRTWWKCTVLRDSLLRCPRCRRQLPS